MEGEWHTQQSNLYLRQQRASLPIFPSHAGLPPGTSHQEPIPPITHVSCAPDDTYNTGMPSELIQRINEVRAQRLIEVQKVFPKYIQPPMMFFDPN
eukprot:5199941-Heterocapsa_arctica.AAC.1